MQFYVTKNGQQLGPWSVMEVKQRLDSRELSYGDLAWREGLKEWMPLADLMGGGLPPAVAAPAPPPIVAGRSPIGMRVVTALVIFVVLFFAITFITSLIAFVICGAVVGGQAAVAQHAQGYDQGREVGRAAGQAFGQKWALTIFGAAAVFSVFVSAIVAWLMSFSNLLPWCRKR